MTSTRSLSWEALWRRLGAAGPSAPALEAIERQYGAPHRHYHTLEHLDACLDLFETVRGFCLRPDEAELALWLHDVVWRPMADDNELESAAWAERLCREATLPDEMAARVGALILATRHDGRPLVGDAAVVADVDLAILGASPPVFDAYEAAIRREYAAVPEDAFRDGRRRFLEGLLARASIYATPPLGTALEGRARDNLARSVARLATAIRPEPL